MEKMAHAEFKSQNRTQERDTSSSLSSALSHSYSSASLPPRPDTPSSTLRRSKSVVRPVSVVDVAPGEFDWIFFMETFHCNWFDPTSGDNLQMTSHLHCSIRLEVA